jgi:galactokinase
MERMRDELIEQTRREFHRRFAAPCRQVVFAPGRVNLIGEHTDYNGGLVLPLAIEYGTAIAAAWEHDLGGEPSEFFSINLEQGDRWTASETPGEWRGDWSSYIRGVLAGFCTRGFVVPPFQAVVYSNIPLGGGLSSSAALTVATAALVQAAVGSRLDELELARLCQEAEQRFAGVPCGLMDPLCSLLGRRDSLLLIDFADLSIRYIPVDPRDVTFLIVDSGVRHALGDGQYAARRGECHAAAELLGKSSLSDVAPAELFESKPVLGSQQFRRARHVMNENQRVRQTAAALQRRDWGRAGECMYESHESLRDDFEVSCQELDLLVSLARGLGRAGGVWGARLTGGGFGGCTINLVDASRGAAIGEALAEAYAEKTGRKPRVLISRPADGAGAILG